MSVDYEYYKDTYGGGLSEASFDGVLPLSEAHVRWLCAASDYDDASTAFVRAVCAAVDAFAEFGAGEVGGYSIGEFSVKNYASHETTGEQMATQAALRELAGTGYAYCGMR